MNDGNNIRRSSVAELLRHPLASVLFAFILTGVVGLWLSNRYNEKQKASDLARTRYENGTKAAEDFARLVYRRYTRATMLHSSLVRNAPIEELTGRKKDYDEAFADWGAGLQANLFTIRKLTRKFDYKPLESPVENQLVPAFNALDKCLTQAYDARIRGGTPQSILQQCNIHAQFKRTFGISYDVTEQLFRAAVQEVATDPAIETGTSKP